MDGCFHSGCCGRLRQLRVRVFDNRWPPPAGDPRILHSARHAGRRCSPSFMVDHLVRVIVSIGINRQVNPVTTHSTGRSRPAQGERPIRISLGKPSAKPLPAKMKDKLTRQHSVAKTPKVSGHDKTTIVSCRDIYRAAPIERVRLVESGIPARDLLGLATSMKVQYQRLFSTLGLSRTTVTRKVREHEPLNTADSERVLGMMQLVGQVEDIVSQSGDPQGFDAPAWLAQWLERPLPALEGKTPASYMGTIPGQQLVSSLLAQAQSGAFA